MSNFIYKTSFKHYYQLKLNPNFSRKSFVVQVPGMFFSKWENCKTIKFSEDEFEKFYNFSGDQWMDIFFTPELRSKYFIFTEKVKRGKRK
jgi:hypothetical protein